MSKNQLGEYICNSMSTRKDELNQYQWPQLVCYANPRIIGPIEVEHENSLEILWVSFITKEN